VSMIFDRFQTRRDAESFAAHVTRKHHLRACVYDSQADSETGELADVFPWQLDPPIVLVERSERPEVERCVERVVQDFNGVFAGT